MVWKYGFMLLWGALLAASVATLVQAAIPSWPPTASRLMIPGRPPVAANDKHLIIRAAGSAPARQLESQPEKQTARG